MSDRLDRILIVDDDELFSRVLRKALMGRFDAETATSLADARTSIAERIFHGVLLDVRLRGSVSNDIDGLTFLREIRDGRPLMPVVVMTAYSEVGIAVEAMKLGANDFVDKGSIEPVALAKKLREVIDRTRDRLKIEAEASDHRRQEPSSLIGSSPAMAPVRNAVGMAAGDGYCSVLILGETGSGKEVVARAIHEGGWRSQGPFVAVSMAGLSPSLLESELFGHEKGAFTGATQSRIGYIEKAGGGVLFLDEIGDLSAELQVKLLRFLEDRLVFRLGSSSGHPVDTQVIAATHRPLRELISNGTFREDLYYRLKTVEIVVPPLRERKEDIPLLSDHFLQLLRRQGRTKLAGFSPAAVSVLIDHRWPGNCRELRAVTEWAVLAAMQAKHYAVEVNDLPSELRSTRSVKREVGGRAGDHEFQSVEWARVVAELECIEAALQQTGGRKAEALERLGYPNRHTMRRRIQRMRERFPDLWKEFPSIVSAYESERGNDDEFV